MLDLSGIFKNAYDGVKAKSRKEILTDAHKAQIAALKSFVNVLNKAGEFSAALSNPSKAVPVFTVTNMKGLGASFLVSFGCQGFGGPVSLRLSTLPEGRALNNVDDGYDLTTDKGMKSFAEDVAAAVARAVSRQSLLAETVSYMRRKP
ncbi:MAG: hypothetical protein ACXW30_03005 [Micavibrio sp.]